MSPQDFNLKRLVKNRARFLTKRFKDFRLIPLNSNGVYVRSSAAGDRLALRRNQGVVLPENFNSKTVANRVAARLELTLLSAVAAAEDAAARVLPNALTDMWVLPARQRDRPSPRQAKVSARERARNFDAA